MDNTLEVVQLVNRGAQDKVHMARVWAKVDVQAEDPEACWYWQGATFSGHALPRVMYKGKYINARRFIYAEGSDVELEGNTEIHATCGHKLCCNPRHLVAVDSRFKTRVLAYVMNKFPHCDRGHKLVTKDEPCAICEAHKDRYAEAEKHLNPAMQKAVRAATIAKLSGRSGGAPPPGYVPVDSPPPTDAELDS